jgi:hypothetical protein
MPLGFPKTHAGDQHLHPLRILQRVQGGHRVDERGHLIASEPKSLDRLFREFRLVMNHDNEGRHWVHPLGVFSPCEDSCLSAI